MRGPRRYFGWRDARSGDDSSGIDCRRDGSSGFWNPPHYVGSQTIDRIVDVFPAAEKAMVRSMLSESLQAVISQTLLKRKTGGRVAAHEIMRGTAAIRNLIREDKVAQMYSAIQTGQSIGMQTMDQSLQGLVQKRVISLETAREKARQPEAMVA